MCVDWKIVGVALVISSLRLLLLKLSILLLDPLSPLALLGQTYSLDCADEADGETVISEEMR